MTPPARSRLALTVLALLLVALAGCGDEEVGGGDGGEGAGKVRVGLTVAKSFEVAMPSRIGVQQGFFKKEGVEVEVVAFQGGSDLVKGITTGAVEIGSATGFDAAAAVAKGVPLRAFAGYMAKSPMMIVASAKGNVRGPDDLAGAKVGVTRFGSLTEFVARQTAQASGLDPKDLKLVALGGAPQQFAALQRGETKAFVWSTEFPIELEERGAGRIISRFSQTFPEDQYGVLIATPDYLEQNRERVQAFLRGYFRSIQWMRDHKQETLQAAAKQLELPPAVAERTYDELMDQFSQDGTINEQGLRNYAKALPGLEIAPEAPDVSEFITRDFVPVQVP